MGHYIFSYGIKSEEIQKVFGSNDETLLDRVQSHKTFQSYAEEIGARGLSIGLKDISTYPITGNLHSDLHGYAFLCICASLGTQLPYPQEIKLGIATDEISKVMVEDLGIKELDLQKLLIENGHFFPLSKIMEPCISLIMLEELKIIKTRLSSVHITNKIMKELEYMGDLDEVLRGLIQNFNYCVDHGLDMISFCH